MPEAPAAVHKTWRRGTDRSVPPDVTLARIEALRTPAGITRLADITGLDRIGLPVYTAVRPNARSLAVSQGKGLDADAARASALMEALECWYAETLQRPLRLGGTGELADTLPLVDVDRLPRLQAPPPDRERALLWVEGRRVGDGAPCWLPWECVHADYRVPAATGGGVFLATTNGLASGNCREEALSHALCECIERDATALWRAAPAHLRRQTRLDPAGIEDADCRHLLARLDAAGFDVALFDTTSDVGVACCWCVLVDRRDPQAHGGAGAGCHPRAPVALVRAITEAVQVRTTYIAGARDDLGRDEYSPAARTRRRAEADRLLALPPCRHPDALPHHDFGRFDAELQWLLSRLEAAGCAMPVAVDMSGPAAPVAVLRVVVPGLEGPDEVRGGAVAGERLRRLRERLA